jgi:hypothetical protein
MNSYQKTGFRRGRPRFGEIRPPSTNAIKHSNWLSKRLKKDPKYKEVLAERQRDWRTKNLTRSNEISRQGVARRKQWIELYQSKEDV